MDQVSFGEHDYIDLSNLNAKWDEARPAVAGLGTSNGVLSGNALQCRTSGLGADPSYPWGEYSADTAALQAQVNKALVANGYQRITADGVLGAGTCGAIRELCSDTDVADCVPGTCKGFTAPSRAPGAGPRPTPAVVTAGLGGGTNWTMVGGAVALFAVGGALLYRSHKKGR